MLNKLTNNTNNKNNINNSKDNIRDKKPSVSNPSSLTSYISVKENNNKC